MVEQNVDVIALSPSETWRIKKNVVVVTVVFMVHYTAVHGIDNLQSSINAEAGLGTYSLTATFTGALISNILLTSIVIKWLDPKWTIVCSILTFLPSMVSQLYPRLSTLVPTGLLTGMGGGILLCAKSTYISVLAEAHGWLSKRPSSVYLLSFSGFFFTVVHMSQIWGNLFSSLVLSTSNNFSTTTVNETQIPEICGSNFLPNMDAAEALPVQPPEKVLLLAGVFITLMVIAALITFFGLDPMKRYSFCRTGKESLLEFTLLAATLKHLGNRNQQLLLALNVFVGLQQAFIYTDYTSSFVSCAIGTGSVGYVMMTYGISNVIGCFVTLCLPKLFSRLTLMFTAWFIHGIILVTLLLWRVQSGDYYIMLIIAVFWGIGDSIWTIQIYSYYGVLFREKEEAAYSNLGLWEGVGNIVCFSISAHVRTRYKIYLVLCNLIIGFAGYLIVEYREYRNNKNLKGDDWKQRSMSLTEEERQTEKEKLNYECTQSPDC